MIKDPCEVRATKHPPLMQLCGKTVGFYIWVCVDLNKIISICMRESLCIPVLAVQGEKAGYGISKIISLPDGKTSHIPFEVPHMIPCKGCVCVCVAGTHNYDWIT